MFSGRIEVDTQWRYVKMEDGAFFCDEKYVHRLVPNAVSVAQLIVDIGSLAGKIANNEFGALDQVGDFPNNETRSCTLINAAGSQPKFAAFVLDGFIYLIHIYATERHDHEGKALLEDPFVGWVIIRSAKFAVHKSVFTAHNRYAPSSPWTEQLFAPV